MSLKIKNPFKFVIAAVITILLIIFVIVGFLTVLGKVVGFFTGKNVSEQSPTPSTTTQTTGTSQPTSPKATDDTVAMESLTLLVNKTHELPADYVPSDLVEVPLRGVRTTQLRQEASTALVNLFEASDNEGLAFYCASGFRDYATQKSVHNEDIVRYGEEQTNLVSAKEGQSEHQTGLVMDLTCEANNMELTESFYDTPEGQWLAKNAHQYGFIIRFLEDKTDITGYAYEPWHIRYVGVDTAKKIYEKNQTLEEYLGQ